MGFYAEPWLREARDSIKSVPERSASAKPAATDFDNLAEAVEKAIKAALVEIHGSIPHQLDQQNLVSICQSTGVWDVLPPALRGLIKEVESLRATSIPQQSTISASSLEQLQRYFLIARRLIDYMEFHVIGNDSVLKRLTVV